jgi:hypothetical protein
MMSPLLFLIRFSNLLVVIIDFGPKIDKFPELAFAVQSSTKKRVARFLFCSPHNVLNLHEHYQTL